MEQAVIFYGLTLDQIIQSIGLFILVVGIFIALVQLRGAKEQIRLLEASHSETNEWNRRIAAQEALFRADYSSMANPVQKAFGFIDQTSPISLEDIEKRLDKDKTEKVHLHQLLNYYESLARGVLLEIYDEEVILEARRSTMTRLVVSFEEYIVKRQETVNPKAWVCLVRLTQKWGKAS